MLKETEATKGEVSRRKRCGTSKKENDNTILNLTGKYKKIESDCREKVQAQLERMKELCREKNNLYEKQNELKGYKQKIEKSLEQ